MNTLSNNYPTPAVPLSPVLSWDTATIRAHREKPASILNCKYKLPLTSGRAAIALALEHAAVADGDEVLVPAYHCESMVAPVRWRGAKPVFYRIKDDASADIADIERKITDRTKAIIITHYFGFLQNLPPIVDLCHSHAVKVIEDCAHTFFGSTDGKPVGSQGDYAIASSMKFFPVLDGGLLASNTLDVTSIKLQATPLSFQLKSLLNSIESSVGYKRLGVAGKLIAWVMHAKDYLWGSAKKLMGVNGQRIDTPSSSEGGQNLDDAWIRRQASSTSSLIVSRSDANRICQTRRANYQRLHAAFSQLPECHALHANLAEGIVPLVYPLYVEKADLLFDTLKKRAVPIWRFGEYLDSAVTRELCENSVKLSSHIFQFPCHQELQEREIAWIIDTVTSVFSSYYQRTN